MYGILTYIYHENQLNGEIYHTYMDPMGTSIIIKDVPWNISHSSVSGFLRIIRIPILYLRCQDSIQQIAKAEIKQNP